MKEILLPLAGRDSSYRILIQPGLRRRLGELLAPLNLPPGIFVVSDRRVARLYGPEVCHALAAAGFDPILLTTPVGERTKTWAVVQRLAKALLAHGAHRQSALMALGGGVVGDVTGFLSSLFMRGTPFIQMPTSLLAMVDASIGGKTAINLPEGKNLLGTFHQPRLVLIDPEFLGTLPASERLNGLAETVKAGFIRAPELLQRLDTLGAAVFSQTDELTDVIHRAAAIKAGVVAADEREGDLRRILNFGHTLGHGLEQASGFKIPHGRAVAWGMDAALKLSQALSGLPRDEAGFGLMLLHRLGLTCRSLPRLDANAVLAALAHDKKRQEQGLVFVLLRHLGQPVMQAGVPLALVGQILAEMLGEAGGDA
jgi:3-dehydroquinate synthase